MSEIKLVIFDCDGVMFDSKNANRMYYDHILAVLGHPPMDAEELEYVHIHNVMDSVRHILRHYPADIEKAEQYRADLDYQPFLQYMHMEPDLIEFLQFLTPRCDRAISTNRTNTMRNILDIFGLSPYFGKVVTAFDVERPKPHPDALLAILDHFGRRVDESIYIGDSIIDRQHASSVGMRLIAFKNRALDAEYHVDSFMEIAGLPLF
ncbi:MAG: beta-phosphoglucomutase [Desulfobulbaceae bacterium DB1]|nr:MAG: beta-phosphoglucomutase [Desulfobulbaceae bacterium DB1]